jgi:hypothetical protein
MAAALRPWLLMALAAVVLAVIAVPHAGRRVLDPDDPIAADGSMIAGRAATFYDTNPAYDALRQPPPGSDDPRDVAADIESAKRFAARARAPLRFVMPSLDWSLCASGRHAQLLHAVGNYYGERGREIGRFAMRGPNAKAAIEQIWSTPDDRSIDDYVRRAVQYGVLHKGELPERTYPEFARLVGDVQELGTGCPAAGGK